MADGFAIGGIQIITPDQAGSDGTNPDYTPEKIHYTDKEQPQSRITFADVSIDKYPQYNLGEIPGQIDREVLFSDNTRGTNPFQKDDFSRLVAQQQAAYKNVKVADFLYELG